MGFQKKESLPVYRGDVPASPPTVDDARQSLGGRASTTNDAGRAVVLKNGLVGIVVFASAESFDVCTEDGRFYRTRPDQVTDAATELPESMQSIAADARIFATLDENRRVRYQRSRGKLEEGLLAEKCRYGALIATDDGRVLAVSFRRLWPLDHSP